VEATIRAGLGRSGIASGPDAARLAVASRTDAGVSARANALVLESELPGPALLRTFNGISSAIFATAATPVDGSFRVRSAARRTYRYYEPPGPHRLGRWRAAARALEGTIDVRSFGRGLPADRPVRRTVDALRVRPRDGGLELEIVARAFVWGMVRKIVAALREVDAGRLSTERLAAAAAGRVRLTLPLAEPEGLVLWDVEYPVRWAHFATGPNRAQARRETATRRDLWAQGRVLDALSDVQRRSSDSGQGSGAD